MGAESGAIARHSVLGHGACGGPLLYLCAFVPVAGHLLSHPLPNLWLFFQSQELPPYLGGNQACTEEPGNLGERRPAKPSMEWMLGLMVRPRRQCQQSSGAKKEASV